LKELPKTTKTIAVLDRTKEPGSTGEPLYLDVLEILKDEKINIVGGRYGLSSKDVPLKDINAVFENIFKTKPKQRTDDQDEHIKRISNISGHCKLPGHQPPDRLFL
jgi:pyruvate/2-oxoacid:ferredoxin oxidoreductase alpha subunit